MKPERPQPCSLHAHVPASNLPVRAPPGPAAVLTLRGGGDSSSLVGSCLGRTGSGPCAKLEAGRRGWRASDPAWTGKGAAELQGVCPHFLLQREGRGRWGPRSQRRLKRRNLSVTEDQVPPGQDLLAAARFQPGPQPAGGDPPAAGASQPLARRQASLPGGPSGLCWWDSELRLWFGYGCTDYSKSPRRFPGALGAGRTERVLTVVAVQCAWVGE